MACDTFLTIAKTCRREFVVTQPGEMAPFIEEILASLPLTIADLEPHHVHSFYEACGKPHSQYTTYRHVAVGAGREAAGRKGPYTLPRAT